MSACAACGRRHAPGDAFCAGCGRALGAASPPALEVEIDAGPGDGTEVVLARPAPRRWWVGAAVVGLAGIVAASVATGGGPARSDGGTTTAAARPTTTAPATTAPATTEPATTVGPGPSVAAPPLRIGAGPLLGEPTGLALVVSVGDADRYLVDLDAATATRIELPAEVMDLRYSVVGLVGRDTTDNSLRILGRGAPALDQLVDASYLGSDARGRAWFIASVANRPRYRLLYLERGAVAAIGVDPPGGGYALPDGTGGLLIDAPGGVYRWTDDAPITRVSTGRMATAGGGTVVVGECDESLRCVDVAVDVVTGARRELPVVPDLEPASYAYGSVSPDGRVVLAVRGADDATADGPPPGLVAVTADGAVVELGPHPDCLRPECGGATWSPDGRWLVWTTDRTTIAAWRPGLERPLTLALPDAMTNSYAVGPGVPRPQVDVLVGPADELRALA